MFFSNGWHGNNQFLFERLPEFLRHLLNQVRSSVKLSRGRLQEFDTIQYYTHLFNVPAAHSPGIH